MKLQEIVQHIGASVIGSDWEDIEITGVASLRSAAPDDLSFLTNVKYKSDFDATQARAVVVAKELKDLGEKAVLQIVHPAPILAVAKVAQIFWQTKHGETGISPLAFVSPSAQVPDSVTIYPFAYIGPGACLGEGVVVYSGVHIGCDVRVGAGTVIYPNTVIMDRCEVGAQCIVHGGTVIGGDGFGFVPTREELLKIPQMGKVVIEDNVEIGSACTIDRATFDQTIVRRGTKLDSQVHIGHNVDVGEQTMLCAQVGVAGSTTIGRRCIAAGQVGISNGIEIGDNMVFGGKAGVIRSANQPGEYHGMPAIPAGQWIRQSVALEKLPELLKRVQTLEKLLDPAPRGSA